jgi:sec-independent protein translocase protein TatA
VLTDIWKGGQLIDRLFLFLVINFGSMNSSVLLFFNLGGGEIIVVLLVVLLFFGSKKIPELARGLGKGIREFKDATGNVQREIQKSIKDIETPVRDATKTVHQSISRSDSVEPKETKKEGPKAKLE